MKHVEQESKSVRQTKAFCDSGDTRKFLRPQLSRELRQLLFCVLDMIMGCEMNEVRAQVELKLLTTSPNLIMAALSFWSGDSCASRLCS